MATVTKTFKENEGSGYLSTWTVNVTGTDQTVSGNFKITPPTVTAKYVYSGKTKGSADITLRFAIRSGSSILYQKRSASGYDVAMTSGTFYSIPQQSDMTLNTDVTLSNIFNTGNKTSRTVDLIATSDQYEIFLRSSNKDDSMSRSYTYSGSQYTWGKIATITLNAPPTFNAGNAASDTNGFYAGISTASVAVSSCSAKYGGDITQTKLTIGSQSVTGSGNGTLSIRLNTAGTFTPTVTVTDSRGQTTTKSLSAITVNPYIVPQVTGLSAERTTAAGIPDDEGTAAVITAVFSYTDAITDLMKPLVSIGQSAQADDYCTWYSARAADGTLSDPVNWSSFRPASPVRLYGYLPGTFDKESSYIIGVTARDSYQAGIQITQTLPQAYYTMDVYAGGHGIAFGAPATEDGFRVAMPAVFTEAAVFQDLAGAIQMFAGAEAPDGWLLCHGQAVSRTEYAVLFAVIGTTYGAGDGSATFNLPDLRNRFPVGAGSSYALNAKGGADTVTLTTNQIPAHTHGKSGAITNGITGGSHSHSMNKIWSDGTGSSSAYKMTTDRTLTTRSTAAQTHTHNLPAHEHTSVGGGQAHENRPPYIGIHFIICTGRK